MSMITATAWVPRGFAAPFPTKYTFDEEEFKRIADLAKLQLDDAKEDLEEAQNGEGESAEEKTTTEKNDDAMSEGEGSDAEESSKALNSKT
jgi:periodic tryptophan protein 1